MLTSMAVSGPLFLSHWTRLVSEYAHEGLLWWEKRLSMPPTEARSSHSEHTLLPVALNEPTPALQTCRGCAIIRTL